MFIVVFKNSRINFLVDEYQDVLLMSCLHEHKKNFREFLKLIFLRKKKEEEIFDDMCGSKKICFAKRKKVSETQLFRVKKKIRKLKFEIIEVGI